MSNDGRLTVVVLAACDRPVAVMCLNLMTSKPKLTSPSGLFSSGVLYEYGRWRSTAYLDFSDFG